MSCALGEAPHKPGYGYGGDVIKREIANPTISEALQLHETDATKEGLTGQPSGEAGTSSNAENKGIPAPQQPNAGVLNSSSFTSQPPSSPPRVQLPEPPQPPQPLNPQHPPAVLAPQAQRVPPVAAFEMQNNSPPSSFDPYSQPPPLAPHRGFSDMGYADDAMSIISAYDEDPTPSRGGRGGRGGMPPRMDSKPRGGRGGYPDRGRGGMPPRKDVRGPPQNRPGYGPPPFAGDQRPSSRQGGRAGYGPPPFAGDQRPSSRQGGRGGYGPPPFAGEQRPSSRQGGRAGYGGPSNRGRGQAGYAPRGGVQRGPPPQQQMPFPPQQRSPPQEMGNYGRPNAVELQ